MLKAQGLLMKERIARGVAFSIPLANLASTKAWGQVRTLRRHDHFV